MDAKEVTRRYQLEQPIPVEPMSEHKEANDQSLPVTSLLRQNFSPLFALIDSLPGIVFSCANDPEWSMTYLSSGVQALTGYQSEELVGNRSLSYDTITHPEDLPKVLEAIEHSVASGEPYVVEYRIRTKCGQEKWVWEKGAVVKDSSSKVLGLEGFITDITDRKQAEAALQQAEVKYRSIFENSIEGIFQTTPDGQYISANPALAKIYGYATPALLMEYLTDIEHQLYVEPSQRTDFQRLLQENDAVSEFESQVYRQDGSVIWIAENARAVRDETGKLLYYEGTVEDITDRKRAKEQLRTQAFYDPLTGLPNRAMFMERLRAAIARDKECDDYLFAVLFLDLDRFKVINDTLGHLVGDQLLVAIARRLEGCVRSEDIVARLGGDEFTILLDDIEDLNNAIYIAERIHQELGSSFKLDGHEIFTAASIGIVLNTSPKSSQSVGAGFETSGLGREDTGKPAPTLPSYNCPEDILRDADIALYSAKAHGTGLIMVFDMTMRDNAVALLQIETDLRRACDRGEFEIHYQPIVSLSTGNISSFEALLRWRHPTRGLIDPSLFIQVAEETGLIIPIGWWMLSHSCNQLKAWQMEFPGRALTINVNLSSKQFFQPDLLMQIDKILLDTGLNGSSLILEITESCLQRNADTATAILTQMRERQVRLCIDDFGTGYSSLSLMHRLPINGLKIDCSFVSQMTEPPCFGKVVSGHVSEAPPESLAPTGTYQDGNLEIGYGAWGRATPYVLPPTPYAQSYAQIVRTITELAHNLGMEVIAEGVETAFQLNQLRALECQYAQGYFFSHPVDAEAAGALIASTGVH